MKKIIKVLGVLAGAGVAVVSGAFLLNFFVQYMIHREMRPEDFRYTVISDEDKTCSLTKYTGASHTEMVIPGIIDGYTVVKLDKKLFKDYSNLTGEIHIPETVTSIEDEVFYHCARLTGPLNLPDGLTDIGNNAFRGCEGLNGALVLPEGLVCIGDYAFAGCGFEGELIFPSSIRKLGSGVIYNTLLFYDEGDIEAYINEETIKIDDSDEVDELTTDSDAFIIVVDDKIKKEPKEVILEAEHKSIWYDDDTKCISGEIEIFEMADMDRDGEVEQHVPQRLLYLAFNPSDYYFTMLRAIPLHYKYDNVYDFEINISDFTLGNRYFMYIVYNDDGDTVMMHVQNDKYSLPEGEIKNTESVYVHYSDCILYIKVKEENSVGE